MLWVSKCRMKLTAKLVCFYSNLYVFTCSICISNGQIQLKSLAEEMQAMSKGLEKVEQELTASENDGAISAGFQKVGDILGTLAYSSSSLFFFLFFRFMLDLHRCT